MSPMLDFLSVEAVDADELTLDFLSKEGCWLEVILLLDFCPFNRSVCSRFILYMLDIPNTRCNFESTPFVEMREFSELLWLSPARKKEI